ncbi:hypothetical protein [Candidatus Tokpelaia sp.]|uniref:hypothetical protein n=1 Tax=Candidatus Tokpelaia sp. TaxID=2233777 RepID=UPI0012385AF4|nr:hypothetical protein [Candidatus Tokpelaia sp.]KAA6404500.1 hypothetical protein DPQ22_09725 [Candidatus Tokpelaia sp.]
MRPVSHARKAQKNGHYAREVKKESTMSETNQQITDLSAYLEREVYVTTVSDNGIRGLLKSTNDKGIMMTADKVHRHQGEMPMNGYGRLRFLPWTAIEMIAL